MVQAGLPSEFAESVLDSALSTDAMHSLGAGTVRFCCAAHGQVGSSLWIFRALSRIVMRLLSIDQDTASTELLLKLIQDGLVSSWTVNRRSNMIQTIRLVCARQQTFDTDPLYGSFLPSFDTYENALLQEHASHSATLYATSPSVIDVHADMDVFSDHLYVHLSFPEIPAPVSDRVSTTFLAANKQREASLLGRVPVVPLFLPRHAVYSRQYLENGRVTSPFR